MGVLARAALVALAACYEPALIDCKIACESADDCAGDQVCGRDGLCAAPAIAGTCARAMAAPDAALPADAAIAIDAAPPDAATVMLRVQIEGKGSVVIAGVGTCSSDEPARGDCTYDVPPGATRSARAVPAVDQRFTRWSSLVCGGQGETCTFTPLLFTSITAKFDKARL